MASLSTFEALLSPLLGSAYGVAFHMTRNRADAQDVVQEAALQAFRAFDTFQSGTNFRAWFFRILTNCCISRYRKTRRHRSTVPFDDVPDLYLFTKTAEAGLHRPAMDPAQALLDKLDHEEAAAAIASLPGEYRMVCSLYFMQDCSYQEIAQMLGVPVGTVRSRLHRGRKLLQKALWQVAADEGIVGNLNAKSGVTAP